MKTIAVDVDETVNSLNDNWLSAYNAASGDALSRDMLTHWDIHKFAKMKYEIYTFLHDPAIYTAAAVKENAVEVIEQLAARYDVYFLTSCVCEKAADAKRAWCKKHFPFVNECVALFSGSEKYRLDFDLLIDDRGETVKSCHEVGKQAWLFDQPWNKWYYTADRVWSWQTIGERLL